VFRDSNNQDLPKAEWYYVDVISVAALKRPDVVKTKDGKELYEYEQDRDEMISKVGTAFASHSLLVSLY